MLQTADGHYLISARHAHTISYINGTSGDVIWTLGGKRNDFADLSDGNATNFAWQHHARFRDEGLTQLTFFDNHRLKTMIGCQQDCSRGRHLELDYENMTVRVVQEYYHPQSVVSGAMGGYDLTPSGNVLIGWGLNPAFTEFTPDGEVVLDIQYTTWDPEGKGRGHYRTFKGEWKGHPTWDPSVAWTQSEGKTPKLWVSWNGATEVASYQLVSQAVKTCRIL
jgi:hypothetical protein